MKKIVLFPMVLLSILAPAGLTHSGPSQKSPDPRTEFKMEYTEDAGSLRIEIPMEGREIVFQKTPDFRKRRTVSGAIPMGENKDQFIGFIWDFDQKKLLLDLNRNLDLTDDSSGVFTAVTSDSSQRWIQQQFTDVRFHIKNGTVLLPYRVDVNLLHDLTKRKSEGSLRVISGWRGTVTLDEFTWQIYLLDNLDGSIGKGDEFALHAVVDPKAPPVPLFTRLSNLQVTKRLFLNKYNYIPSYRFEQGKENALLKATFEKSDTPIGSLTLEGKFLKRFIFINDSQTVVINEPTSPLSVPAGQYNFQAVYLDEKDLEGKYVANVYQPLTVSAGKDTVYKVGAPLTGKMYVTRRIGTLNLEYQLTGIGGENFLEVAPTGNIPADQTSAYYELDFTMGKEGKIRTCDWNEGKANALTIEKIAGHADSAECRMTYEMALQLPAAPEPGRRLLFSAVANDNDGKGRVGVVAWSLGAYQWPRATATMGGMVLSGKPAGTVLSRREMESVVWPEYVSWDSKYKLIGFQGTPAVDGDPSDSVWQKVDWTAADQWIPAWDSSQKTSLAVAKRSMRFKVLYDDQNYYFLFETTDNATKLWDEATGGRNMWQGDCIQMAIVDVDSYAEGLTIPKFAVSKGDKMFASGAFEYG